MRYYILQLPRSNPNFLIGTKLKDVTKKLSYYDYVYVWTDEEDFRDMSPNEICEKIYEKFNMALPKNFAGHFLSVSDVILLRPNPSAIPDAYFCDGVGFKKLEDFFH